MQLGDHTCGLAGNLDASRVSCDATSSASLMYLYKDVACTIFGRGNEAYHQRGFLIFWLHDGGCSGTQIHNCEALASREVSAVSSGKSVWVATSILCMHECQATGLH